MVQVGLKKINAFNIQRELWKLIGTARKYLMWGCTLIKLLFSCCTSGTYHLETVYELGRPFNSLSIDFKLDALIWYQN